MTQLLEGRIALITGAGSNVGRAATALFREHGAKLALADIAAGGIGGPCDLVFEGDMTSAADCMRMVEETVARFGRLDILCCTVGIDPPSARSVTETSPEDWARIMSVNVDSVFLACRAALPAMCETGGGAIVTVASQGALLAMPGMAAYGVSKAAVLQLTRQIAADYGRAGIRANCVCPSGLQMPSRDRLAIVDETQLGRRAEAMSRMAPLGRICTPMDVAGAMLFLASGLSGFVTGAALPVEGGGTMALRF